MGYLRVIFIHVYFDISVFCVFGVQLGHEWDSDEEE